IVELSGGESLRANIALVKNNARLGAAIAAAYAGLRDEVR
ncbi:MAG: pseudouridine-5'-phosphate glycosidase, partial [Propionibacteriaceae bacterium]|nr:pseudouridine-5'-phosphate glycosidase [Propionibacteriaceae bacterium]